MPGTLEIFSYDCFDDGYWFSCLFFTLILKAFQTLDIPCHSLASSISSLKDCAKGHSDFTGIGKPWKQQSPDLGKSLSLFLKDCLLHTTSLKALTS